MLARSTHYGLNQASLTTQMDAMRQAAANICYAKAGLAIGSGDTAKILQGNTVEYMIDGVQYSKATQEVGFTATTHDITANASTAQARKYLLTIDSSGSITITAGAVADTGSQLLPEWSAIPTDEAIIGVVTIVIAAGSTDFDASSDALSAGHITDTYVDTGYVLPKFSGTQ